MQVTVWEVGSISELRRELAPAVRRNRTKAATTEAYDVFATRDPLTAMRLQVAYLLTLTCIQHRPAQVLLPCA